MEFPQLQPLYVRREAEPDYEKEIWQPSWSCFCCHDTGEVAGSLVTKVIPTHDPNRCLIPLCQKRGCAAGAELDSRPAFKDQLDRRLTPEICAELDRLSREDWAEVAKGKHQSAVNFAALVEKKTMPGARGRTDNDNREIAIRKEQAQWDLDNPEAKAKSTDEEFGF